MSTKNFILQLSRQTKELKEILTPLTFEDFQMISLHKLFPSGATHSEIVDSYAQVLVYTLFANQLQSHPKTNLVDIYNWVPVRKGFLASFYERFLKECDSNLQAFLNTIVQTLQGYDLTKLIDTGEFANDPVLHFYEKFLAVHDPKERKAKGVFYTPKPVVSYMVRSVDELLTTEFNLADGIADVSTWQEIVTRNPSITIPEGASPSDFFVMILDPATGTASFPVFVVEYIHSKMTRKWESLGYSTDKISQLWQEYAPTYLIPRLYGYEIMFVSYAIAHLRLGLSLRETGYEMTANDKFHVYLTNALELPSQ